MGKWLDRFKHVDNMESVDTQTDNVDILGATSTLSVRESKETAKNELREFSGVDQDGIGAKTSNSSNSSDSGELVKQNITASPNCAATTVICGNCRHFVRDKIGDGSGIGDCAVGFDKHKHYGEYSLYPYAKRRCAAYKSLQEI